jgi:hypothetical protein
LRANESAALYSDPPILPKGFDEVHIGLGRFAVDKTNDRNGTLLRPCRKRHRSQIAYEFDKVPPSHVPFQELRQPSTSKTSARK